MIEHARLAGTTVLMSGGSRGIGLAMAVCVAKAGANVAFIAKTATPDPRLPGTIYTAAAAIVAAGGQVLPIHGDVRDGETVASAVEATVERFGSVDVVINNASVIDLGGVGALSPKRFDLLLDVNVRGTYRLVSAALPHLLASARGQVMTLSPPLSLDPRWLTGHAPYTVSKYGMTMLTLGLAHQYRAEGLAAYCLWPETLIATAAVQNVVGGSAGMAAARTPEIMADAALSLLTRDPSTTTARCHLDAEVLRAAGRDDLANYAAVPGTSDSELTLDLFVPDVTSTPSRPL